MTNLRHHLLIAIILTVCALSTSAGHATTAPDRSHQDQNAAETPSRIVWDILVEGNRLVPTDDVLKLIKIKRGDKFDRDKVIQDLQSIKGLGYFDEQGLVCIPELASHGVILKFRLKENMPIYEFICEGNKAFSTLEILSSTPFLDQLGKPA